MSQPGSYMDEVPVKISEKYKPLPRVLIPAEISHAISAAKHFVNSLDYDFSLETNILKKLEEIRRLKDNQEIERKLRLQAIAEEKQKKLDLIAAAEAEEKLKQLSISDVSYPSSDDSIEISPDETGDKEVDEFSPDQPNQTPTDTTITSPVENKDSQYNSPKSISPFYPSENPLKMYNQQDSILKPTLISSVNNCNPTSLLDDPNPIKGMQHNVEKYSVLKMVNIKNNIEKLTYSDFEHDTSSPFDNMELKTINDMEMLAQVLNTQSNEPTEYNSNAASTADVNHSNHTNYQDGYTTYYDVNNCSGNFDTPSMTAVPFCSNQDSHLNNSKIHSVPAGYDIGNGVLNSNAVPINNPNTSQNGYYDPIYSYYQNNYQNLHDGTFPLPRNMNYSTSNYFTNEKGANLMNKGSLNLHGDSYRMYNYNYQHAESSDYPIYSPLQDKTALTGSNNTTEHEPESSFKSRSRSVPDIIKELDEEITSARIKMKERSYNASPAPNLSQGVIENNLTSPNASSSENKSDKGTLDHHFRNLPDELQTLCKYISSMGFPIERVARACQAVGPNDKKLVEYLLMIGELMDLGFTESQVASALIKNDFNRDEALDDLVS